MDPQMSSNTVFAVSLSYGVPFSRSPIKLSTTTSTGEDSSEELILFSFAGGFLALDELLDFASSETASAMSYESTAISRRLKRAMQQLPITSNVSCESKDSS